LNSEQVVDLTREAEEEEEKEKEEMCDEFFGFLEMYKGRMMGSAFLNQSLSYLRRRQNSQQSPSCVGNTDSHNCNITKPTPRGVMFSGAIATVKKVFVIEDPSKFKFYYTIGES
jgi:hypothetical protein